MSWRCEGREWDENEVVEIRDAPESLEEREHTDSIGWGRSTALDHAPATDLARNTNAVTMQGDLALDATSPNVDASLEDNYQRNIKQPDVPLPEEDAARAAVVDAVAKTDGPDSWQDHEAAENFDERAEALENYELDSESLERAHDIAQQIRTDAPVESWQRSDFESRLAQSRDIDQIIRSQLQTDSDPVLFDNSLRDGKDYGWSSGETVAVGSWMLDQPDSRDIIETLAHEQRHQWQDQVIRGEAEHPLGDAGRQALIDADSTYERDLLDIEIDPDKYIYNERELDAEKFARIVGREYNDDR